MVLEALMIDGTLRLVETTTIAATTGLAGSVALGLGVMSVVLIAVVIVLVSLNYF